MTLSEMNGVINKMDDSRSDEALIELYRQFGDKEALEVLLTRYQEPLWHYARQLSWYYKDKSFIDDIRQEILLTIAQRIDKFNPVGPGSFKAWVYLLTQHKTFKANERRRSQPILLSQVYPEEFPDDLADRRPQARDYRKLQTRLDKVLSHLSEEERQLFTLLSENKTYEEIARIKPFDKYKDNLPALRQKICRLRKFLLSFK